MLLVTNLSGIKLSRTIETTTYYQSQGIDLQIRVRLFRCSNWLLCNLPVKFEYQKFTDTFYKRSHSGRFISKNGNSSYWILASCLGNLRAKFQGNPLHSHTLQIRSKNVHSRKMEVGFIRPERFMNISLPCWTKCQHCGYRKCRQPIERQETPTEVPRDCCCH